MVPQWIIEKKRDGYALSPEEVRFFISGFTRGEIPDYQMSALAMAILLRGMDDAETAVLTEAMMLSGAMVDTSGLPGPKLDKHSTGGIGDKVSLVLAPLLAACGASIPMISGRGLGISGGTLDKLAAIPGYRTNLTQREFLRVVHECGCSITGQTAELAPADKKLYALRDVTGTVPSIPLIVASIMCKKLAEGIDGLVLDVKCGRGAFMKTLEQAQELARRMVDVGVKMGKKVSAIISAMDEPLGCTVGNALEVIEALEMLRGGGPDDLRKVTTTLSARLLLLGGICKTIHDAEKLIALKIGNGEAMERFSRMVALQGGDVKIVLDTQKLPKARIVKEFPARQSAYVSEVNAELVGRAAVLLGAGRERAADNVNPAVGFSRIRKCGERVETGDALLLIHADDQDKLKRAEQLLDGAFVFSTRNPEPEKLIIDSIP